MKRLHIFFCLLVVGAGIYLPSLVSAELIDDVRGRILLDVEQNGEAWYVNPLTDERFYLGRPADAFNIMRNFGLGISDADLGRISRNDQPHAGDYALSLRLSGRILLRVEAHGEAWYVNPADLKRYYLGRPADAFALMRELGLGIAHNDLGQIRSGGEVTSNILFNVPFTAQAPFGEWSDLRQQEGCEEASVLMAVSWARGQSFTLEQAKEKILAMSEWQQDNYGYFIDTSAQDTAERLLSNYQGFYDYRIEYGINATDVREELMRGNLVIVPVNGKDLANPYFYAGGPIRHMLVVTGYDWANAEFVTNEPGTRKGQGYKYSYKVLDNALRDYISGEYVAIPEGARTAMIIIAK